MYVVHFKRRSAILTLAGVVLAAVLALVLAGCFGGKQAESVTLADDAARVEYLTQLGWQADSDYGVLENRCNSLYGLFCRDDIPKANHAKSQRVIHYPTLEKGSQ